MIDRNCTAPHELVCATDDSSGLDAGIRTAPIERDLIPVGNAFPKLAAFRPDAAEIFGRRICVIDLDVVIAGSIDEIVSRPEPFVIWKDVLATSQPSRFKYNSSLILMDAGVRPKVWESFDRQKSPRIINNYCGSDQAWISHMLNDEAIWSATDGIRSWRLEMQKNQTAATGARMVFFHGKPKPWMLPEQPIVKEHWH